MEESVTPPVNVLTAFNVSVPPTVVVPVTPRLLAAVRVVPEPTLRLPPMVNPITVLAVAVPLRVRFPPMAVVPACNVLAPLLLKVRW